MLRSRAVLGMFAVLLLTCGFLSGADTKDTKIKGQLPPNWGKLGLTDEQKQKVYKIQADYRDKIADLEKQIKDLEDKRKADMEKVLTDEQKKRLREILTGKAPEEKK